MSVLLPRFGLFVASQIPNSMWKWRDLAILIVLHTLFVFQLAAITELELLEVEFIWVNYENYLLLYMIWGDCFVILSQAPEKINFCWSFLDSGFDWIDLEISLEVFSRDMLYNYVLRFLIFDCIFSESQFSLHFLVFGRDVSCMVTWNLARPIENSIFWKNREENRKSENVVV